MCLAHAALREFCVIAADYSQLSADDRVLQFATFSFDGFVEQCYPPLCVGAALVLRGDELWDTDTLYRQIIEQGVTLADLPAAYWYLLAQEWAAQPQRDKGRLRQVHVGGEAMSLEGLRLGMPPVWATCACSTPTGRPKPRWCPAPTCAPWPTRNNLSACRLAAPCRVVRCTCWTPRAICCRPVASASCASAVTPALPSSYHQRPGLSAERFIADPFSTTPGARLYRSGDLARYREDGALEYLGRIDHQVKIRGFRVELGELEAHLQGLPMISEAAVLVHEGVGGKQLIGYVVSVVPRRGMSRQLTDTVRQALGERLPDYMLPAQLVVMERIAAQPQRQTRPRGASGAEVWEAVAGIAPQGELEIRAGADLAAGVAGAPCRSRKQLLRTGRAFVAGHADRFADSSASGPVGEFAQPVRTPAPCRISPLRCKACGTRQCLRTPGAGGGHSGERQPLSFAQQRLWFLWNLEPDSSMYNMPGALRLRGELNLSALRQTFETLVQRHAVLRTTFYEEDGQAWQRVHAELPLSFRCQRPAAFASAGYRGCSSWPVKKSPGHSICATGRCCGCGCCRSRIRSMCCC